MNIGFTSLIFICLSFVTFILLLAKRKKKNKIHPETDDITEQNNIAALHMFALVRKIADNAYLYSHDCSQLGNHIKALIASDISADYTLSAITFLADSNHNNVIKKLTLSHPDLSVNESGLCSMIILGCTNSEICSLMGYKTLNSVYVKKNRIKNKLRVSSDKSLELYLNEITVIADNQI